MSQGDLFQQAPRVTKDGRPRRATMTAAGRARLEQLASEPVPAGATALDLAELYCRAGVAAAPTVAWLGAALDAHLELEAVDIFGVGVAELYWRLHPGGPPWERPPR